MPSCSGVPGQAFQWPLGRPAGLAAYPFGERLGLADIPEEAEQRVRLPSYQLARQAVATVVQERSNAAPFATVPFFDEAEVRAVFSLTAHRCPANGAERRSGLLCAVGH